jgi:hypothetical protein
MQRMFGIQLYPILIEGIIVNLIADNFLLTATLMRSWTCLQGWQFVWRQNGCSLCWPNWWRVSLTSQVLWDGWQQLWQVNLSLDKGNRILWQALLSTSLRFYIVQFTSCPEYSQFLNPFTTNTYYENMVWFCTMWFSNWHHLCPTNSYAT